MSFLGFEVYRKNPKLQENKIFAVIALCTAMWIAATMLAAVSKTEELAIIWVRLTLVGPIIFAPSFYQFSKVFPQKQSSRGKENIFSVLFLILPCIAMLILVPTRLNIISATIDGNGFLDVKSGILYPIFFVYFLGYLALAFKNFFYSYKTQPEKNRVPLKLLMFGLILTVFAAVFLNIVLLTFGINNLARFGSFASIFFVGFTAYAILSQQLFSVRVVLTEFASVFLISTMIVGIIISSNQLTKLIDSIVTLIAIYGSSVLIRSVNREIKQKDELGKLADELKEANRKLEELDKMKTEFVSIASHELLTPISAIEGYLSMMVEEKLVKIDDPKAIEYVDIVYKASKHLTRLVTDLLNVARIEEGRLLVEKIEIDAKEMINQVTTELRPRAEKSGLSISTYFQEGADTMVYVDPDKINETLKNIAANSIKYTPEGGHVELGCFIYETSNVNKKYEEMQEEIIRCNEGPMDESLEKAVDKRLKRLFGDKQLVIFAKDTGIGLKPDDLCRLFKKFSRVGEWSTRKVQGTGLGLYVSRALVEMHHGRIWAESAGINAGSQFFFSVPLAKNKKDIEKNDKTVPQATDAKPLAKSREIG